MRSPNGLVEKRQRHACFQQIPLGALAFGTESADQYCPQASDAAVENLFHSSSFIQFEPARRRKREKDSTYLFHPSSRIP